MVDVVALECKTLKLQKNTKYNYLLSSEKKKNIFITGSTGFIGIFLLEKLLINTTANIYCLIRVSGNEDAFCKVYAAANKHQIKIDWKKYLSKLHFIKGDVSKVNFGLSNNEYSALNKVIDVIYHLAGNTSFIQPYSLVKAVNVFGTEQIIRFATKEELIPVHYVSTFAVFSCIHAFKNIKFIDERRNSYDSYSCLKYDIGYVQSKWVAEQLLQQAIKRGVPVTIYRSGFVLCHYATGAMEKSHFWHAFIKICLQLKVYPILIKQKEEFISVDFMVNALFCLSQQEGAIGSIYHICPNSSDNIDIIEVFNQIEQHLGINFVPLPYKEWLDKVLKYVELNGKNSAIYPFIPLLRDKIYMDKTALEIYQNTPDCTSIFTDSILQKAGIIPPSTKDLLIKYIEKIKG